MYKIFTIILMGSAVVWFLLTLSLLKGKIQGAFRTQYRNLKNCAIAFRNPRSMKPADVIGGLRTAFYILTLASMLILAATGFVPYLMGNPLAGFNLLLHVSLAPLFAISITVLILLLAYRYAVDRKNAGMRHAHRLSFWMLVLLAPFVMGSIVLSMYPIFGTEGQVTLLIIHRLSAILFLVMGIIYTYYLIESSPDNIVTVEVNEVREDVNHEEKENDSQAS